jgi:hypothetical protein
MLVFGGEAGHLRCVENEHEADADAWQYDEHFRPSGERPDVMMPDMERDLRRERHEHGRRYPEPPEQARYPDRSVPMVDRGSGDKQYDKSQISEHLPIRFSHLVPVATSVGEDYPTGNIEIPSDSGNSGNSGNYIFS